MRDVTTLPEHKQWGGDIHLESLVECVFPIVMGGSIPADYRYLLYSALKAEFPQLTERGWSFLPIAGEPQGDLLELRADRQYELAVRMPRVDLQFVEGMSKHAVRIGNHIIVLGEPRVRPIRPAPVLRSDLVIITSDDETRGVRGIEYGMHIGKRLGAMLGHLDFGVKIGDRRRIHIRGTRCFGHVVTVLSVSNDESLKLQRHGLGESRAMGCGVFEPLEP
jgi:CRISPR-associated protein Cas6